MARTIFPRARARGIVLRPPGGNYAINGLIVLLTAVVSNLARGRVELIAILA